MHKDMLTLLEKKEVVSNRTATAGHARQLRHDPRAAGSKGAPLGKPRTVLLAARAGDAPGLDAACVAALGAAGHRIVKIPDGVSLPHPAAGTDAHACVVSLPGPTNDAAGMQCAIRSLPAPFRCVDAVVGIMYPPPPASLLGGAASFTGSGPTADASDLLEAAKAALPALLASKRGHVIAVSLCLHDGHPAAGHGHADALCAALRSELDDLGIRFTRIRADAIESRAGAGRDAGNRPRPNGMRRGLLAPGDVAGAIAWTLAQPSHLAIHDIGIGAAPQARPALSPREQEVLEWIACGKTSEDISCILSLSVSAVNFHVKNLLCKLDCCNKTAAVARAALLGLLR